MNNYYQHQKVNKLCVYHTRRHCYHILYAYMYTLLIRSCFLYNIHRRNYPNCWFWVHRYLFLVPLSIYFKTRVFLLRRAFFTLFLPPLLLYATEMPTGTMAWFSPMATRRVVGVVLPPRRPRPFPQAPAPHSLR